MVNQPGLLSDPRPAGEDPAGLLAVATDLTPRQIVVRAGEQGLRFLLVSGRPLREPVAWHGPIVMNTARELEQAYAEIQQGSFLDRR